jgi:predicted nucleic acid-binding protein
MPDIHRADPARVRAGQRFLFDTNVWLDLYYPSPQPSQPRWSADHAAVFRAIKQAGAEVVFNVIVLSELVNAVARREFHIFRRQHNIDPRDFKRRFRDTPAFEAVKRKLRLIQSQILPQVRVVSLPTLKLPAVLEQFDQRDVDVNDAVLARCAEAEGCILLTSDADMGKVDTPIEVWTANPRLLSRAN